MTKAICLICSKERGRRACRIKDNALICSPCCTEIRNQDCTGCEHFAAAEKFALDKYKKTGTIGFIVRMDPQIEDAVDQALARLDNKEVREAEEALVELQRKHPDYYVVQYGVGVLEALKGNCRGAIAYFDQCLKLFPYCIEAWFNKGMAHKQLLEVTNAYKSFLKVVELGTPDLEFVIAAREILDDARTLLHKSGLTLELYIQAADEFDRAFSFLQNGRFEEALAGFQRVLKINHNHQQSYGNIGLCHAYLGHKDEALAAYNRALEIAPDYEPARQNRDVLMALADGEIMPQNVGAVCIDYYKDQLKANRGDELPAPYGRISEKHAKLIP